MKYRCDNCGLGGACHEGVLPQCQCGSAAGFTEIALTHAPIHPLTPSPFEIGGTHYKEGVKTSPWDLQRTMESSGNAFVDARRADAIKYAFRIKGDLPKLLEDLRKAKDCLEAGIKELHKQIQSASSREARTETIAKALATGGPSKAVEEWQKFNQVHD